MTNSSAEFFKAAYDWTARDTSERLPNTKLIVCVVGTRPEAIKMAPVAAALNAHKSHFDVRVVLTGQHPIAGEIMAEDFGIVVNQDMSVMRMGQSLDELAGKLFFAAEALKRHGEKSGLMPDMILVQGDTTSAFGVALAAFHNKIPVGHVEAGLRTYDRFNPWPEEMNRRLIGTIADIHFAPTTQARDALLKEGVSGSRIALTGNPVVDALQHVVAATHDFSGTPLEGLPLDEGRLIVATMHRRESWGDGIDQLTGALRTVVDRHPDTKLVIPVHPNPEIADAVVEQLGSHPRIFLIQPLRYGLFISLMAKAHLILTDSGGIQEEAPSLDVPALVMRETTERGEATVGGQIKLIGRDPATIVQEASRILSNRAAWDAMRGAPNPFGDGYAGARIALSIERFLSRSDPQAGRLLTAEEEFEVEAQNYRTASTG